MNTLIQRLLDLIKSLQASPAAPEGALHELLRAQAMESIQDDPLQANVPAGTDPVVEAAINAGAAAVAALAPTKTRVRLSFEDLPIGIVAAEAGEQRVEEFGPFLENTGRLLRFILFHSSPFIAVKSAVGETVLLIPAASAASAADPKQWALAAGTIWIQSRLLVAGSTGLAGLRIAGGTVSFALQPQKSATGLLVPAGTWTLSVQPEQPAVPAEVPACDAESITLKLPARLDVHSNAAPAVSGAATVEGFGSTLTLNFHGAPVREPRQIRFPMDAVEGEWSIGGNLSSIAQLSGTSPVSAAGWAIPVSLTAVQQIGEAVHGGSITLQVPTGLHSTLAGQHGGLSDWFASTLTFNGERIELEALQAASAARYDDLSLWSTSKSDFEFTKAGHLLFRSIRGGFDTTVIVGGGLKTSWDLPCDASGKPFPFDGAVETFGVFMTSAGTWLASIANFAPELTDRFGVALENVYLTVRRPGRLLLTGSFDDKASLPTGAALLLFDVIFAIPTLPDPYAVNWAVPDAQDFTGAALRMELKWTGASAPAFAAHLDKQVRFPELQIDIASLPDDRDLYQQFQTFLQAQPDSLFLLDVSSRQHLFGVSIESPAKSAPELLDNRLSFPMRHLRLLMQPQVQWEPIQVEVNPVPAANPQLVHSTLNGGPTLIGVNSVTLVPSLPESMTDEILAAIGRNQFAAALFSLPFGLRALAKLSPPLLSANAGLPVITETANTELHEPVFNQFSSARQLRVSAGAVPLHPPDDPARRIPGILRQLPNLAQPNPFGLSSVTPPELLDDFNSKFSDGIPLHRADLSGYGLSCFSEWVLPVDGAGVSKVEFQVLNGRTAYEVIQFRSILYECGARVVRTVILERHNAGRVYRFDSGWVAMEPGLFRLPLLPNRSKAFENLPVLSFQNIRRIRLSGAVIPIDAATAVQPVIFDADAEFEDHRLVPFYDRPGYVEVAPPPPAPPSPGVLPPFTDAQLEAVFARVGPIAGPINAFLRVGTTLDMQISSIVSDFAPDDAGGSGFAIAIVGSPKLPPAGQWSVTRIDPATGEISPVDPRRGVPVTHPVGKPYRICEPSDARRDKRLIEHGLLVTTESSRVLFRQPFFRVDPAGRMEFDLPPLVADPYSLVQATGHFPRPAFALALKSNALFHVGLDNNWRIDNPAFQVDVPLVPALLKGGEWGIDRSYNLTPGNNVVTQVSLGLDSSLPAPLKVDVPTSNLNLNLPQFPGLENILTITGNYTTVAGGLPKLDNPGIFFSGALEEAKKMLSALSQILGLPFGLEVWVTAGPGSSPSFVVHLKLALTLGTRPDDRVEIGMGKFYGQFTVNGELEAALTGVNRALLSVDFKGDVQQGILPPLLYAGGLFRFHLEINESGSPTIELTLGVVFSIGGDLIPGLISVEATVHYGYTLVPETLEPGALIGLDAHAKLLGGLIGFSFAVEAMARVKRVELGGALQNNLTVWAHIRVAASIHIAIFFDEDVDFETQFEQTLPLAILSLVPGVGILPALTLL